MIVAATTDCFPDLDLADALGRMVDLEYTYVELVLDEHGPHLRPSQPAAELQRALSLCQEQLRLGVAGLCWRPDAAGEEYYRQFQLCCKLAKAAKVVTLTIPSGELGTPFNEEVERLRKLAAFASLEGVRVGIKSQVGRLSEDPDTVAVLCDNVPGLGLALDPSHYICGPHGGKSIDKLMKYVHHVQLRDTTKDKLQVRVGQGEVDYGKLIQQLRRVGYDRALSVDIAPLPDVDHGVEMRKMRLLLESVLL